MVIKGKINEKMSSTFLQINADAVHIEGTLNKPAFKSHNLVKQN